MLRKLALTGLLAATASLAACSQDGRQGDYATTLPAGFGLFYLDEGPSAKLAYGQANSDNVGLMLQCAKGSRMVEVSDSVRSSPAPTLVLTSGGKTAALKAEVHAGEGPSIVTAQTSSSSPVLAGFRQSGKMEVSYAGLRYGVAAKPDEKAGVERFFSACERRT
ncbi:MAG: hypothetical protein B7Y99_12020 [Caulobacterales bacterium 32-69-10]|nr:MAG: hypothetical protein B7Y99_12020 [Caulobacterales bacterium 32-69-10]